MRVNAAKMGGMIGSQCMLRDLADVGPKSQFAQASHTLIWILRFDADDPLTGRDGDVKPDGRVIKTRSSSRKVECNDT